jgi:dynein heavy chain, axonemal
VAANRFILSLLKYSKFVEPPPEETKVLYEISSKVEPILFLLSAGADPTGAIDDLAREKKKEITKISLGEGQEEKAKAHILEAITPGSWILL